MNVHVHQVISRYLVFYVFRKIKIDPPDQLLVCNAIKKTAAGRIISYRTAVLFSFSLFYWFTYLWIVAFTAPGPASISRNMVSIFSPTPSLYRSVKNSLSLERIDFS